MKTLYPFMFCAILIHSVHAMDDVPDWLKMSSCIGPSITETVPVLRHYPYDEPGHKTLDQLHFDRKTRECIDRIMQDFKCPQRPAFFHNLLISGHHATGKKSLVRALARETERDILDAHLYQFLTIYRGSAAQNTEHAFEEADVLQKQIQRPLILWFEHFELFCNHLSTHDEYSEADAQLCSRIKWLNHQNPSIFFIATYDGDMPRERQLELVMKTPHRHSTLDRFDFHINLPLPDRENRTLILGDYAHQYYQKLAPNALARVATWTSGWDAHVLHHLFKTAIDEDDDEIEKTKKEMRAHDFENAYKHIVQRYPDLEGRPFFTKYGKILGTVACSSIIALTLLTKLSH